MNSIYFDFTSFFLNKNILLSRVFFYNKINILFLRVFFLWQSMPIWFPKKRTRLKERLMNPWKKIIDFPRNWRKWKENNDELLLGGVYYTSVSAVIAEYVCLPSKHIVGSWGWAPSDLARKSLCKFSCIHTVTCKKKNPYFSSFLAFLKKKNHSAW